MNKKYIDIILTIICFIGFLITNWYGLTFLAGAFFGEYIFSKYKWFDSDDEDEVEETWASQFEVNRYDEDEPEPK